MPQESLPTHNDSPFLPGFEEGALVIERRMVMEKHNRNEKLTLHEQQVYDEYMAELDKSKTIKFAPTTDDEREDSSPRYGSR